MGSCYDRSSDIDSRDDEAPSIGFNTIKLLDPEKLDEHKEREPQWSPGNGIGLRVRLGPDHRTLKNKGTSRGNLYECISVDIIKGDNRIDSVMGRIMQVPPHRQCGNGVFSWTSSCPLPRIICLNVQLPYRGMNPWGTHDPGCSIVALFHIKGETLDQLEHNSGSPSLELFKRFCQGPCGNLENRMTRDSPSTTAGILKATSFCTNLEECANGMPSHVYNQCSTFNGQPFLITKSGNMERAPDGEWMEISMDVRLFATAARVVMAQCRDRMAKASVHVGFLIQGIEDDELPEGLIGDCVIHNVHIEDDAKHVDDLI